jgi:hypothetical protein
MIGSLVFEEASFAFPEQSAGTPDLPMKLNVNNKYKLCYFSFTQC